VNREVSIREPLGVRTAQLPLTIGGEGADLVVPGVQTASVTLDEAGQQWTLHAADVVVVNGSPQRPPLTLAPGDVVRVGAAQLVMQPLQSRIQVVHLAGNNTIAPVQQQALPGEEVVAGVREILAAGDDAVSLRVTQQSTRRRRGSLLWLSLAATVLGAAVLWALFGVVPVTVQVTPTAATVHVPGWLDWRAGDRVYLMPGRRTLEFSHPGYRSQRVTLAVTRDLAPDIALPVQLALLPGLLEINTQGEAAELLVDGRKVAVLPGTAEIEAGSHDILVRAPRRIDYITRVDIQGGGRRQSLDVRLLPASGWLVLDTLPAAARVTVDGEYRGNAPQRLELDAGLRSLSITAAGRRSWNSQVAIIAGQTLDLGKVDLALPAPPGMPATATGVASVAEVANTAAVVAAPRPSPPARLQSPLLGTLRLLPAGSYQQGSDRREQGRRANEVLRSVTLTQPFYLAEAEVSNAQFRAFRATHLAGIAMEKSLDLDAQAASNMSWSDAVEFCNWLSLREGLPAAYERREGRWQRVQPLNHGYRLPTEAEWEYAARYVNGQRWQRYAWGDMLPPPAAAANLAGQESLPVKPGPEVRLAAALPAYRDEHAVIAPVGSYARSAAGFMDLGGNVSEWMHDVYASLPDTSAVTDPQGAEVDGPHSIRGASWRTAAMAELRLAWRERAAGPAQTIGFRVARSVEMAP
jgi:formylglycine-generating enzyme required for sulfatase activity